MKYIYINILYINNDVWRSCSTCDNNEHWWNDFSLIVQSIKKIDKDETIKK